MHQHGNDKRIARLKDEILLKHGAYWKGTTVEFMELLMKVIPLMPEPTATAMDRYYLSGGTRQKNEHGRPDKEDSSFYNLILTGRIELAFLLSIAIYAPEVFKNLETQYARK